MLVGNRIEYLMIPLGSWIHFLSIRIFYRLVKSVFFSNPLVYSCALPSWPSAFSFQPDVAIGARCLIIVFNAFPIICSTFLIEPIDLSLITGIYWIIAYYKG